jgi:hypothetical protein
MPLYQTNTALILSISHNWPHEPKFFGEVSRTDVSVPRLFVWGIGNGHAPNQEGWVHQNS